MAINNVNRYLKCLIYSKFYIFVVLDWANKISCFVLWTLVTYLTDVWGLNLTNAAMIVNVLEGVPNIISVGMTVLADAYLGRYLVVLLSAAVYSIGLSLLTISVPPILSKALGTCDEQRAKCVSKLQRLLLYMAISMLTIGMAGQTFLGDFWCDQVKGNEQDTVNPRHCRSFDSMNIMMFFIIVGAYVLYSIESWAISFGILAVFMVIGAICFLCGTPFYLFEKPRGSPLTCVLRVFVAATLKRNLNSTNASELNERHNPRVDEHLLPHSNTFRFLDKAAIIDSYDRYIYLNKWRLCTVTEVEETKLLLNTFPIWMTIITCGLDVSIGSTYFLEQANNMESRLGSVVIPVSALLLLFLLSELVTTKIYAQITHGFNDLKQRNATMIQIGAGIALSVLCCTIAALVESKRLNIVKKYGLVDNPNASIPLSAFWLAPQFILLGAVKGLSYEGLKKFLYDETSHSMKSYADPFSKSAVGIGTILSIPLVAILNIASKRGRRQDWFADTLNKSHLDYFYWILTILSFINLCIFVFIYKHKKETIVEQESTTVV